MGFIRGLNQADAQLYYRNGYCVTKKGTPVYINNFRAEADVLSVSCFIKGKEEDRFSREKVFQVDHIVFEVPKLGYVNDYEHNRVVYGQRRVNRGSTRVMTSENIYISDAITGKSVNIVPSLVRQLFNPHYVAAQDALKTILACKSPSVALSPDTCMIWSQTADSIIIKVNETPVAYYDPLVGGSFRLLPETLDYVEHLNRLFGGRLNVTF